MEMKPKEAIEVFKKIRICCMEDVCIEDCHDCQYNIPVNVVLEAESISIPALEKQDKKKPKHMHSMYCRGSMIFEYTTFECCECGKELYKSDQTEGEKPNYCSRCGQAIDWSK